MQNFFSDLQKKKTSIRIDSEKLNKNSFLRDIELLTDLTNKMEMIEIKIDEFS